MTMTDDEERALANDVAALTIEIAILNRRLTQLDTLFQKYEHLLPKPRTGLLSKLGAK
jgi:hypothetical protein